MEPPAKRMRILHSVEVDEDNAEYIKAKQKQQQKLKSRFESIFEKFGNMNPSQSDEIDFNTNRVVVDRGHLRRIKRRANGKEKTLLETVVMGSRSHLEDDEEDEQEGEGEDSEDELAPPQLGRPKAAGSPEQDTSKQKTAATETNAPQPAISQPDLPSTSIPHFGTPQTPYPPNSTADILRHVQFPQTPAGQQAQTAFHASLLQTINQAIHQAVSGFILPNAPMLFANAAPPPITPVTTDDKVAPATDPKWFFPPLSVQPRRVPVAQSSPLPGYTTAPIARETDQHAENISMKVAGGGSAASIRTRPDESSPTRPRRTSPRVEIQRRVPRTARKYHFTREDDVYISKRKRIDGVPWAAIKDGQQKWKEWPMAALHSRWNLIKDQNLHLQESAVAPTGGRVVEESQISKEHHPVVSKPPHHLPTPSSSEHEDYHQSLVRSTEDGVQNLRSSSTHYDDDDRDLLSLAGNDSDEDQLPVNHDDDNTLLDTSGDVILPSIETRDLIDEDTLQSDLLVDLPTQDDIATPVRESSCIAIKAEPAFSSPTTLRTRKHATPLAEVIPDSQETEDELQNDHNPHNMNIRLSETIKPDTIQLPNPQNTHISSHRKSPSLDLIGTTTEDELLPSPPNPTTPSLNCAHEPVTPRTAVPFTTYRTPKVRNDDGSSDKGSKSTSKADRKAFHKRIKREWTRKGTPAKDSAAKRRCLGGLEVRKRRWVDVDGEGSEDELAKF
ncbi:uncharacterized protein J4E84_006160 [Alternaria hordeiaustralica]|uniref:uncharacterized protein n=1 Tax=Alternaria hordeiaustralica TaxID=1187925 RepID=UPI0020C42FAD|nr:uncharacterized protein J4E84_006160 [Alternaria hordeiaustralica]KAI4685432.1 hypothetical protein J4E84_006160 [Alternaria hordeiaustralica]